MTTVLSYPNRTLLKAGKVIPIIFMLLTARVNSTEFKYEDYPNLRSDLFQELPTAVCTYLRTLPKIGRQEESVGALTQFLLHMRNESKTPIEGIELFKEKLSITMAKRKPLSLVLLGYPFKSTNTEKKVISSKVDMGELVGLLTLNHICKEIGKCYTPGSYLCIYSDEVAYREILNINETIVAEYKKDLITLINYFECPIKIIDFNPNLSTQPIPFIDRNLQKGMAIFMHNELDCALWKKSYPSQSRRKEKAEELAKIFTEKSAQFGNAVKEHLDGSDYIRLSIHPHADISKKCTIASVLGSDGTPWHLSPYITGNLFELKKRKDVKEGILKYFNIGGLSLASVIIQK